MASMLVSATLLIQDVQLVCFTIVFGVLAFQRWNDATRRWLWYNFLANSAGAFLDFFGAHFPAWVSHGINLEMYPLSYALVNVAIVHFEGRSRRSVWLSGALLVAALPVFLLWSANPSQVLNGALGDGVIALESVITVILLGRSKEQSTRAPRLLMGGFLCWFVVVELARVVVAFLLHTDPDAEGSRLAIASAVTYIVDTSLLPLAFIWMMNARLESDLLQQSLVDPLTRVLNRRGLEQSLDRELARCRRYGQDLTLAMVDLDHFKKFNDAYGHAAGDTVLRGVAKMLVERLRDTDVVGRFGGEEFVLLLSHTDQPRAVPVLEELCAALRRSTPLPDAELRATGSFGATTTQGRRTVTALELLSEADAALYKAKESGRDQVRFFSGTEGMRERFAVRGSSPDEEEQ